MKFWTKNKSWSNRFNFLDFTLILYPSFNMKIYHNPRCSKSRCALDWLQQNDFDIEVVDYLKSPLNAVELKSILTALKMKPMDLIRRNEAEFKEHIEGKKLNDDEIILKMVNFPKLIERPIVVWEGLAVVARPLEKLTEMLRCLIKK